MIVWMLAACSGPEQTAAWAEGTGFTWQFFNHRLSHLELGADEEGAYAAVVGGTSTTGEVAQLSPSCDAATCQEFPFFDFADVSIRRASATTRRAVFGAARVELEIGPEGGSATLDVPLGARAKGIPVAVIRGMRFDTARELLGGPDCYDPAFGWLPDAIGLALSEPSLDDAGELASVEVSATFTPAPTHEDERECLDAAIDRARIGVSVDVLVVVPRDEARRVEVSAQASYGWGSRANPDPQPPPAPTALGDGLEQSLVGWSAWSMRFHETDGPRGAYLRTVDLALDAGAGEAVGVASSFSPGTQLTGFDYRFDGAVEIVPLGVDVPRDHLVERIPVALDEAGRPEVVRWEPAR